MSVESSSWLRCLVPRSYVTLFCLKVRLVLANELSGNFDTHCS